MSDAAVVNQPGSPSSAAEGQPQEGKLPFSTGPKHKFDSKAEETLWKINDPAVDGSQEGEEAAPREPSISKIIDKATGNAGKSSKEANEVPEAQNEQPKEPPKKQKYVFEGKEIEVDDEHAKRLVQKGMLFDKKGFEIAKYERGLKEKAAQVEQQEQQIAQLMGDLKEHGLAVLEELAGPEKLRQMAEQWLRPRIEREMLPPEQQQQLSLQEENARLRQMIEQRQQAELQHRQELETQQWIENYNQTIVKALQLGGVPRTDFTAAEMATWMQRGLDKNIEYTPEQLAGLVKQDNIMRVGSLTEHYVREIEEGRKAGDSSRVVKSGEALVELLGEPVMFAIGKYYLARTKGSQPAQPKQILDTPKVVRNGEEPQKKRHYLSEDEVVAERKRRVALMQQGIDPGEWE